jgi:rhamnose transport system substrate-binding protein
MKLVATVYGDDEPQKSTTECEGLLAKYPDLSAIVSPTSVGLAASAQVLQQAGVYPGGPKAKGKGIQLTGLSTPKQMAPFVNKGVVTAFQLWSPYNEGYLAAYIGSQIKQSKLKPGEGAKFTTPELKESSFHGKNEVIAGPLITFDKSNVEKYAF